ncbi:hypothetical protein L2E82_11113 [Cichorium intybus]|uniref:Uncharacterized protein n=1 Tax=Cichorium intybus TaxID=13427 RepID=A0ACB9GCJ1_CICIN|nr:hypothetical protein L2E82_11113 [Cichorium intybus]
MIQTIDQEQPQVGTFVDAEAFGGPIGDPVAADIHGQPLSYGNFVHGQHNSLNQFQDGSVSRGLDHAGWRLHPDAFSKGKVGK